jgi:hypothetical protein
MGIFDQAKEFADQHADKIEQGIDKAGDLVDGRTGGTYVGQVDQAQEFLKDKVGPADEPAAPEAPPAPPAP